MTFTPSRILIANITQSNPAIVACVGDHNLTTGQVVRMIVPKNYGMFQLNNKALLITVLTATAFSLQYRQAPPEEDVDSTNFIAFTIPSNPSLLAQIIPMGAGSTPHYATAWEERNQYCESEYDDATTNIAGTNGTGSFIVLPLAVQYGGTGLGSLTAFGFLIGNGTDPVISTPSSLTGQVPIGSTGATPVVTEITAGLGIDVVNGPGSITISTNGSVGGWNNVTTATQTLAVDNGYVTNRGGGVVYTLPATATVGNKIDIVGKLGAWSVSQNANQSIRIGSVVSTIGIGGSIASTNVGDCVSLICTTTGASTTWVCDSPIGNITVI